jgi:hypothetical protein
VRNLWAFHRRALLLAAAGVVAVAVLVALAVIGSPQPSRDSAASLPSTVPGSPSTSLSPPSTVDPNYHPTYISVPPPSPGSQVPENQVQALEAVNPPSPLFPPSMSALSATQVENAENFAYAFIPRLLGIDFAHETRQELAEWTQAESAASMLPGLPAAAADNTLYASLFDPGLLGEGPSPVPSVPQWAVDAKAGVVWHVASMTAREDPQWAQAIAAGYQSADQLMTVLDVSGNLSKTVPGKASTTEHFSFALGLGSALHHPNYGAASTGDWKVG